MTAVDEAVEVDVSIDETATCDITKAECSNPATWACVLKCCRASFPTCDQHKQEFETYLRNSILITMLMGDTVLCGVCDAPMEMPNWVAL